MSRASEGFRVLYCTVLYNYSTKSESVKRETSPHRMNADNRYPPLPSAALIRQAEYRKPRQHTLLHPVQSHTQYTQHIHSFLLFRGTHAGPRAASQRWATRPHDVKRAEAARISYAWLRRRRWPAPTHQVPFSRIPCN